MKKAIFVAFLPLLLCVAAQLSAAAFIAASSVVAASPENAADTGVIIDGDVTIGGLFPVSRGDCSRISSQRGIQRMEAMIFSLMEANSDQRLLRYGRHKIRLGGLLFDTCSSSATVRARVTELLKRSLSLDCACLPPDGSTGPPVRTFGGSTSRIRGVVGAADSGISMQAASMLQLFSIPLVSYASNAVALSDKQRFELFARTIPSDADQAAAMADLVAHFNWTYVSSVFSSGALGEFRMSEFARNAKRLGVCIAQQEVVQFGAGSLVLDRVVQRLIRQSRARVVVLFTHEDHTRMLLDAASRASVTPGHFIWLSADGFTRSSTSAISGALTVQLRASEMPDFTEFFTSLRPGIQRSMKTGTSMNNRYFDEFWQQKFNCSLGNRTDSSESAKKLREMCNSSLTISSDEFKQDSKVQFVYDAVYTFAHGLDKVMKQVCLSQDPDSDTKANGVFDQCVKNISDFPVNQFYDILIGKNNSFINNAGHTVEFTENGDGIVPYLIYNNQKDAGTGSYDYRVVGQWLKGAGLTWISDQGGITWPDGIMEPPTSVCSDECAAGQRKLYSSRGDKCCWVCSD